MKNLILFFGGKSTEHDISIITAVQVYNALDENKYNIFPIYISRGGSWYLIKELMSVKSFLSQEKSRKNEVALTPDSKLIFLNKKFKKPKIVDCAILCVHGINGEDGSLAGLLNMCTVPYVNSGIDGSAICLNKIMFKDFQKAHNIPFIDYCAFSKSEEKFKLKNFNFPIIVKPNCLGSSVGVCKCANLQEMNCSISLAIQFDQNVLIEKCLIDFDEYNIAIYRNEVGLVISDIEQPINNNEILSFNDKYIGENKKSGMENLARIFPAEISSDLKMQIEKFAKLCYEKLKLKGVVRIDFLYDKIENKLYLNEVNTIPGSYANYLFKEKGVTFSQMLDEMIDYAMFDFSKNEKLIKTFKSSVLTISSNGIKK